MDNAPEVTMKTLDTSGSWNSMLIVSFDTNGNYQWNYIAGSINQPTDVKTIAIDKDGSIWNAGTSFGTYYFNPDTGELLLGDIVLCVQKIKEQADKYGHSEKRELAFLTAHSMMHLFGYDHMTPEESTVMEAKQNEELERLGITR